MLKVALAGACVGMAGLLAPILAIADETPLPKPAQTEMKTIGVPSKTKPQVVPSLIVMNSRGATLQGDKLTLTGVASNVIIFADRPVRSAGHALMAHFLEEWDPATGGDSFAKDPPNATLSVFDKQATTVKDAVVELSHPKLVGDDLTFSVKVLEGDVAGADGPASVFIDIIGMPFTPLSFAGVARRTAYRAAFYHPYYGAAAVGAAAAAEYHPYPPPCGYYPYPPCY